MKDLGGATKKKTDDGKELVEVDIPTAPDDVDALWLVSSFLLSLYTGALLITLGL